MAGEITAPATTVAIARVARSPPRRGCAKVAALMARRYWLMKSEPEAFSIQDLKKAPRGTAFWDGIRNYQARNFLRDEVQVGDGVLFYHSNANPPAVVGTATVASAARPDPTQFDAKDGHYDPGSKESDPRWFGLDLKFESVFKRAVPLDELRTIPALADMVLLKRSRLSVQPVTADEWRAITKLGGA
jgi:predicted RNA-binding protein with PUA-like domain